MENPKGILAQSPGLRGTSYPGKTSGGTLATPTGLWPRRSRATRHHEATTPLGLRISLTHTGGHNPFGIALRGMGLRLSFFSLLSFLLLTATPAFAMRNGTPENGPQYNGVGQILPNATHDRGTGVLISRRCVLTAAHNVANDTNAVHVFALDGQHSATVTAFRLHPDFVNYQAENPAFDVAVLLLDANQTQGWDCFVRSRVRTTPVTAGVAGIGVGFGETSDGTGAGARDSGAFQVVGYAQGADANGNEIPNAFLAVGPGNSSNQMICPGDFGGPIYIDGTVAGIASFNNGVDCNDATYGYHVAADRLAAWIAATVTELDPAGECFCPGGGTAQADSSDFTLNTTGVALAGGFGSADSPDFTLNTLSAPSITPIGPGGVVALAMSAQGDDPIRYQWFKDGVLMLAETNSILTLNDAYACINGNYTVGVSNIGGGVFSPGATVQGHGPPVIGLFTAGSSGYDEINGPVIGPDGSIYIGGMFSGPITFGTNVVLTTAGDGDAFIAKLDPQFHVVWVRQAGSLPGSSGSVWHVSLDRFGHVHATGRFYGTLSFGGRNLNHSCPVRLRLTWGRELIYRVGFGGWHVIDMGVQAANSSDTSFRYLGSLWYSRRDSRIGLLDATTADRVLPNHQCSVSFRICSLCRDIWDPAADQGFNCVRSFSGLMFRATHLP